MLNTKQSPKFLETVKIVDGIPMALPYHQNRMNRTINQAPCLSIHVPAECALGVYKCRVIYAKTIESVTFQPYQLPILETAKLVQADGLDYSVKYLDRDELNNLRNLHAMYSDVILVKNGLITDTSFANIVIKHNDCYLTPKKPLLKGTKRQQLIDRHIIEEVDITPQLLLESEGVWIVNAMIRLGEVPILKIIP